MSERMQFEGFTATVIPKPETPSLAVGESSKPFTPGRVTIVCSGNDVKITGTGPSRQALRMALLEMLQALEGEAQS